MMHQNQISTYLHEYFVALAGYISFAELHGKQKQGSQSFGELSFSSIDQGKLLLDVVPIAFQ
jgi:hypothetical protein